MIDDIFYHAATLITLLSLFILGPALGRAWMTRIDGSQGWSVPTQCSWPFHHDRGGQHDPCLRGAMETKPEVSRLVHLDRGSTSKG